MSILFWLLIDKRTEVVASRITRDGDFSKVRGRFFREMGDDVGIAFECAFVLAATRGQDDGVILRLKIHRRITQGKELMAWLHTWKACFLLAFYHAPEEGLHSVLDEEKKQ
jgi:hypothetical protein